MNRNNNEGSYFQEDGIIGYWAEDMDDLIEIELGDIIDENALGDDENQEGRGGGGGDDDEGEEEEEVVERLEDMTSVSNVLSLWEKSYEQSLFDPVPILNRLSEILESEMEMYLKLDPDPFDDRHPIRTHPNCPLGHSLKLIFKKEIFLNRLVHEYMRENWGERDLLVNTAACRLFVNILPGLETSNIFQETEGLIGRLFTWAEKSPEPLQSYSLGLLGASMEVPDIAGKYKDKNTHLVPQMLKRLKNLQSTAKSHHRPFAHLSKRHPHHQQHHNSEMTPHQYNRSINIVNDDNNGDIMMGMIAGGGGTKRKYEEMDNDSSSSWAEMESNIIGSMTVFPVNNATMQIFTLRYLAPLGEYQEMLTFALNNSIELILRNIDSGNSRLQFETLKYLASLLCHKKFTLEFLTENNINLLLKIPRPSISATGLSLVLYYIVYEPDSILTLNQFTHHTLRTLIGYVNWLLDCSHSSSRNHALMFYSSTYGYKFILDLFDSTDGLRRVINIASTSIENSEQETEEQEAIKKQAIKQVCINVKKYFESEIAVKPRKLQYAVEKFMRLNGVKLLFRIADKDNEHNNEQTLVNVFDTLCLICEYPNVQLQILENFSSIMSGIEGEHDLNDPPPPQVQKSCLKLLCKLLSSDNTNLEKIQEATRLNNGLLILTRLLFIKTPVTDADAIRMLASECLVGLTVRNMQITQILCNLSFVQNGTLKLLTNEPILEQSTDHLRFKENIEKLVRAKNENGRPEIKYDRDELLSLISEYLKSNGLVETSALLVKEANLPRVNSGSSNSSSITSATSGNNNSIIATNNSLNMSVSGESTSPSTTAATTPSVVSLDSIVKTYLCNQHDKCENPMSIVPKFSLNQAHKCPSNVPEKNVNFVKKMFDFRTKGTRSRVIDYKVIYSKFKPFRTFRLDSHDDSYSTCTFSPNLQWILAGTSSGEVKLYNINNGEEEASYTTHDSEVYNIKLNNAGTVLLTSTTWRKPLSTVWRMDSQFTRMYDFREDEYIEFSNNQDLIISTHIDKCSVWDLETNNRLANFYSENSNQYTRNRATFSPDDKLILCDGILYDYTSAKPVHKFDKLNDSINGIFNYNGLEIISNTHIWDVRTFKLLKCVKLLESKSIHFSNNNNVLYCLKNGDGDGHDTCFVTLDSYDYSSISTCDLKKPLIDLCVSFNDLQIGVVERIEDDSCVRLYEVGRAKVNDEIVEESDEEESEEDMDEEDDEGPEGEEEDLRELFDQLEQGDDFSSDAFSGDDSNDDSDEDEEDEWSGSG